MTKRFFSFTSPIMWLSIENPIMTKASANSQLQLSVSKQGKPEWTPWCVRAATCPGRDVMGRLKETI